MDEKSSNKPQIKRDPDFIAAEKAMKQAAEKARELAKKFGLGVVVFENGQIIEK